MSIRFSTFNASLNRSAEGQLITDLSTTENAQAQAIAEIIQRSNPDVVLVNEFDFDAAGTAAALFQENYLTIYRSLKTALTRLSIPTFTPQTPDGVRCLTWSFWVRLYGPLT